jgi:hypothetical protein
MTLRDPRCSGDIDGNVVAPRRLEVHECLLTCYGNILTSDLHLRLGKDEGGDTLAIVIQLLRSVQGPDLLRWV